MSHRTQKRFRSRIVPLGLVLALVVVAVPFAASATAKAPAFNPCAPIARNVPQAPGQSPVDCGSRAAALREATGQKTGGSGGSNAGVIAGGAALLALTIVGGVLVATRRRSAPGTRPAAQI